METKLRYVYEVYVEKSFTKAAQKLYIAQPSLSAMVKKVEAELGAAIFDRSASPLELTEEGKAFIEYIQQNLQNEDVLNEKLADIRKISTGRLRIGGSNYVLSSIMPQIIKKILPLYPGIKFELVEEHSFALRRLLENGELDLVIDSFDSQGNPFSCHKLFEERILLAVPPSDPINRSLSAFRITGSHIAAKDYSDILLPNELATQLLDKPFVLLKAENNMYQQAINTFRSFDIHPNIRLSLDQLITSLQYTEAGLGCSFVTDTLFRYGNQAYNVCLYALKGQYSHRDMSIVHKRNRYVSKAAQMFIQVAQGHFSK